MKVSKNEITERLHALMAKRAIQDFPESQGDLKVVLSGCNQISADALLNRNLIIQDFPFKIGKFSPLASFDSMKQDLVLVEDGPDRISEHHLVIEKYDGHIVLADEKSKSGTLVNHTELGKNGGGPGRTTLKEAECKIKLGGLDSPFVFKLQVIRGDKPDRCDICVNYGDHKMPVSALYGRLCHYVKDILTSPRYHAEERIKRAWRISEDLIGHKEVFDGLYFFSAHPETFSDVVVAHSVNVAIYAMKFCMVLSSASDEIAKIGASAFLHDIGLYDIPEEIRHKTERVSPQEHRLIKSHPLKGHEKLSAVQDQYQFFPAIALGHHERVNGKGYPNGISTVTETVERIGIVDFFEAVTHFRPQRGPVTPHMGMKMLTDAEERMFRPQVIADFVNAFSLFPVQSIVQLNSGQIAQVIRVHKNAPLRPIVKILLRSNGEPVEEEKEMDLLDEELIYIARDLSGRIIDRF